VYFTWRKRVGVVRGWEAERERVGAAEHLAIRAGRMSVRASCYANEIPPIERESVPCSGEKTPQNIECEVSLRKRGWDERLHNESLRAELSVG
jgi:hypothetical protein